MNEREAVISKMQSQVQKLEVIVSQTQNELKKTQNNYEDAREARDLAILKCKELEIQLVSQKSASALGAELEALKSQLVDAQRASEKRQKEHEAFLNKVMGPQEHLKVELETAVANANKWKQKSIDLVNRLEAEVLCKLISLRIAMKPPSSTGRRD